MIDVHRALDAVRAMKEFQPPQPSWLDELLKLPWIKQLQQSAGHWLDEAMKALKHLLSQIHPIGISHLSSNIRDVFSGFIGFLLVLLALYALYIILGWLVHLTEKRKPKPPAEARRFEETVLIDSDYHYRQAQEAARQNHYPEALRQLYMGTLCLLDEQAVVPYAVTRSNLEYLRSLELAKLQQSDRKPELRSAFAELARQFEAAYYGKQPVDAGQFEATQAQYKAIHAAVAAHG
jgi:hypothetical protein